MNFLATFSQPVAGATAAVFRVQLPAPGRAPLSHPSLRGGRPVPAILTYDEASRSRAELARQRSRHQAQCRANCMSKAGF